jgi:hypothetical protein
MEPVVSNAITTSVDADADAAANLGTKAATNPIMTASSRRFLGLASPETRDIVLSIQRSLQEASIVGYETFV